MNDPSDWTIIDELHRQLVQIGESDPKVKSLFHAVGMIQGVRGKFFQMRDHDLEDIVRVLSQIIERESKETLQ